MSMPKYYQDSVEELRNIFYRLNLILIGEAAVRFIDQGVFSICRPLWDVDNDGFISVEEAKVTQKFAQGEFDKRSDITTLDDLDKLGGYIYHSGSFSSMPNLVTATTGLKINLTSKLPDKFTVSYANCPKLERIKINNVITEIAYNTFANDISLKTIIWGGSETIIGQSAFQSCTGLEDLKLPEKVNILGNYAFRFCSSLQKINLENINSIGAAAFGNCTNLKIDINMPLVEGALNQTFGASGITGASFGKITEAGYFALANCPNLKYIVLPATVTIIGNSCFSGSKAIEYVVCNAVTPPSLDYSAFNNTYCTIYVPDASVNTYKSATNWSNLILRIKPISEKV